MPSAKRVRAAKLGWRRRRRNYWKGQPIRHSKASKKGWFRRRRGGGRHLLTSRGTPYKKPHRGHRKRFQYYKNAIRVRNPGMSDLLMPIATAIGGLIAANYVISKVHQDKLPSFAGFGTVKLIPAALGAAGMFMLADKFPKYSKIIYGLSFGMILSSAINIWNEFVSPKGLPAIGLSGYIKSSNNGYIKSLHGYVRSLGNVEDENAIEIVKPYGKDISENRIWDEFTFGGVYDSSSYE